jgi:hypothetical protein
MRLVGRAQIARSRQAPVFCVSESLQSLLQVGNISFWICSRGPGPVHLGKIRFFFSAAAARRRMAKVFDAPRLVTRNADGGLVAALVEFDILCGELPVL